MGSCRPFGRLLDPQQRARPVPFEAADPPFVNHPNRHRIERVDALSAFLAGQHERRLPQHIEVLHHGKPRQVGKLLNNRRRRFWT